MLIIYLILYLYIDWANDINFNTMEKKIDYRLEYMIVDNNIDTNEIYCYPIPYPPRRMTFSCTIGNSKCCHYFFAVAY